MTRCETCGRELTARSEIEDVNYDGNPVHFCSDHCKTTWEEIIRNVSVAH
nr:hypothetical protein [Candidatus Njordarchaeum guaymaensis]